jgi:serine protease inhibitor
MATKWERTTMIDHDTEQCSRGTLLKKGAIAAGGLGAGMALAGGWPGRAFVAAARSSTNAWDGDHARQTATNALLAANLGLGFRLATTLAKLAPSPNLFFSPLSISVALTMAYNGAAGATQAAMSSTLGIKALAKADLNTANRALLEGLRGRDAAVKLSIADSIWLKNGLSIVPDFGAALKTYYGADLHMLDFGEPSAPAAINAWVKQQTHGLIPSIVKSIDPATVMYLINALYFKAAWSAQFPANATKPGPFTTAGGTQKPLPMMSLSSTFGYAQSSTTQAIRMPYASGKYSMYIVLPATGTTVQQFVSTLTPASWKALVGSLSPSHGTIRLPRFSVDFTASLKPALSALGMATAFDSTKATFPAMIAGRNAYITDVLHRAIIKVDESGTLAAAVTSVGIGTTAIQVDSFTMDVNRPFFCAIRDDTSGSLLFMGMILNPA